MSGVLLVGCVVVLPDIAFWGVVLPRVGEWYSPISLFGEWYSRELGSGTPYSWDWGLVVLGLWIGNPGTVDW